MQFRPFGKLDWKVSALGFGAMRLPLHADKSVDEAKSIGLIRRAIDAGVNYVDTAWPYHGGQSEVVVGKALGDGYRDRVRLATKSPIRALQSAEDFDKVLAEQLKRLATDHIDFYLLHGIRVEGWRRVRELGLIARAEAARAEGRIRYLGFSFHDKYDLFRDVLDSHDGWDFCMIQYNYMDRHNQAGERGLRYAASKGIPVVVMEPLLGGQLAQPPPEVQDLFERFPIQRTAAAWALRWVWSHPEVVTVLSGMNSLEQLEENLRLADHAPPGALDADELALFDAVRRQFEARRVVPCTKCDYCLPCSQGVSIPRLFELFNHGKMYGNISRARTSYKTFVPEPSRGDRCTACGECEGRCPQGIEISTWMPKVHAVLAQGAAY